MKTKLLTLWIVSGAFGAASGCLAQAQTAAETKPAAAATSGPKIDFAVRVFDFGKVVVGEVVRHDFVFTNSGGALLEIRDVRPGCGCTTAGTWDRQVKPGATGIIPLQFNSAKFDGKVTKSATVTCNDPGKSNVVLEITGTVWKPIEVAPAMAVFRVADDTQTNQTRVVRVINHLDTPLTLSDLQCTNQGFKAELKTVKPGQEFELHITAMPPFASPSINGLVSLKTSAPSMPALTVNAHVMVDQAVAVAPAQIQLPAGPLTAALHRAIIIRNNATNSLILSNATINLPGVTVLLNEAQPGRLFNLTVSFPAGFEIPPDQKPEVTFNSSHPRFSLIKVPVLQPRPAPASAAQPAPTPIRTGPAGQVPSGGTGGAGK